MEGAVRTGRAPPRPHWPATAQEIDRIDFGLTDEQRSIVEVTRAFVERELYPHEEEVERTGVLRPELAAEIRRRRWPPVSTPPTCPRRSAGPASTR